MMASSLVPVNGGGRIGYSTDQDVIILRMNDWREGCVLRAVRDVCILVIDVFRTVCAIVCRHFVMCWCVFLSLFK